MAGVRHDLTEHVLAPGGCAPAPTADTVTVVVPTRNRPGYLAAALASVRAQTLGVPSIVVVDDASDPPVGDHPGARVVRVAERGGAAAARNVGLAHVRTRWVAFLDDDDLWAPTKLARQAAALAAVPAAGWSYTGALVTDVALQVVGVQRARDGGWIDTALLGADVVAGGGSTVLARTDLVRAAGGFDGGLGAAEDWDLWIRLAARAPVVAVDAPLAVWREHRASKSHNWDPLAVEALEDKMGRRAAERARPFVHRYRVQLEIDRSVADRERRTAAALYLRRSRAEGAPFDLLRAAGVLAAPRAFARLKRWERRRAIPRAWLAEAGWITGAAADRASTRPTTFRS